MISKAKTLSPDEQRELVAALTGTAATPKRSVRVDPFGKFAHVPTSVDAFLARKAAEIDLENR